MNIGKIGSYTRLDKFKRELLKEKLWLIANFFIFLPFTSWLLFVLLQPIIDSYKNGPLSAWFAFWGVTIMICQCIYSWYVLLAINELRQKVIDTEYSMDRK
jgi:hypothetical protein